MIPSLYIHIPFCTRKCLYCDFYSVVIENGDCPPGRGLTKVGTVPIFEGRAEGPKQFPPTVQDYINTLIRQIEPLQQRFNTIYIGGGTPTALPKAQLERLLKSLGKNIAKGTEFTVEANPESLDDEKIKLLLDCGVNRLSIGLQSFDDRKLKKLGRIHNAARAIDAISRSAKAGFADISADLIYGVWGEEAGSWERELEEAAKLPITHISCYSLTYEKGTPLFNALKNKSIVPLEDETVAEMYERAIDKLALRGFKQYEVSNFAKTGRRCRHNLSYWENNPYIGLGASAVSYIDGARMKNVSDVAEYIARVDEGKPLDESSEKLTPVKRARETAAVKIRTKDGIDFAWFREKTGYDFLELESKAVVDLLEQGLVKTTSTGIALKRKGFLHCDTVSSTLL
jgi:oxygen-independent coproporphyrinogen-3 oxidase